ncbi:MAG: hypothetical protein K2X93_00440 [Candidatus Obscuribacterales bacterium]|nr:hypothetical protein [Candidatus Obscuribacterales bacterium]
MSDALAQEAQEILHQCMTILEGDHFVYVSGDHGSGWICRDALIPYTDKVARLAELLTQRVQSLDVDIVCGPAVGGLIISQWVGHCMKLPAIFTEHGEPGGANPKLAPFVLKRGFDKLVRGKKVLIVDDVINTGHSIRQTAAAVRTSGGEVVAAAAFCSRGNCDEHAMDVPQFAYLIEFAIPFWSASDCRLCQEGVPVNTEFAHGREFVDKQRALDSQAEHTAD